MCVYEAFKKKISSPSVEQLQQSIEKSIKPKDFNGDIFLKCAQECIRVFGSNVAIPCLYVCYEFLTLPPQNKTSSTTHERPGKYLLKSTKVDSISPLDSIKKKLELENIQNEELEFDFNKIKSDVVAYSKNWLIHFVQNFMPENSSKLLEFEDKKN